MIHETVLLRVRPGQNEAFEAAVAQAAPLFQQADGALSFRLEKRIENPQEYVLAVGWATGAAHPRAFRSSAAFSRWRDLIGPYLAADPEVHHTAHVYTGF